MEVRELHIGGSLDTAWRELIGRGPRILLPWFLTAIKYYFQIIDLSICLPIITALQLRCEISSHRLHVR